jgi:hypothetical protein
MMTDRVAPHRAGVSRRAALWSPAVLGGGLAAACSPGPGNGPPAPTSRPATIGIRTFTGQAVVDMMEKTILPGYRQKAPRHTVEWEQQTTGSGAQMIEAVTAASAAGTPPGRLLHRVGLDRALGPGAPDQGPHRLRQGLGPGQPVLPQHGGGPVGPALVPAPDRLVRPVVGVQKPMRDQAARS